MCVARSGGGGQTTVILHSNSGSSPTSTPNYHSYTNGEYKHPPEQTRLSAALNIYFA